MEGREQEERRDAAFPRRSKTKTKKEIEAELSEGRGGNRGETVGEYRTNKKESLAGTCLVLACTRWCLGDQKRG